MRARLADNKSLSNDCGCAGWLAVYTRESAFSSDNEMWLFVRLFPSSFKNVKVCIVRDIK